MASGTPPAARGIGRPPKTPEENLLTRRRIIEAAGRVYARHGHRGVTVARVIESAGISRGLFYKHFRNAAEPVEALIEEIHEGLVPRILAAAGTGAGARPGAGAGTGPQERIAAVIDVYLDWLERLGPLVRPISAELHDPDTAMFRARARTQDALVDPIRAAVAATGRPVPASYTIKVLIRAVEFGCFEQCLDSDVDRSTAVAVLLRLCTAVIGLPLDGGPLDGGPVVGEHGGE